MIFSVTWILLGVFFGSITGVTTESSKNDTFTTFNTTLIYTPSSKNSDETSRDVVASTLSKQCRLVSSDARMFHIFFYTCMYDKEASADLIDALNDAWSFCCKVQAHCPRNTSESNCRDVYCDCLDLVNILYKPLRDSCKPKMLNSTCYGQTDLSTRHGKFVLEQDVGFAMILKKNLVLGSAGWGCFLVVMFIGLGSVAYTVISYIHFKCNHKPAVQAAEIAYEAEQANMGVEENMPGLQSPITQTMATSVNNAVISPVQTQQSPVQPKSNEQSFVEKLTLK